MIMSICDVPDVLKVIRLVKIAMSIIRIVVPIMLIVSIMIDLLKDVSEAGDLAKTGGIVVKKLIAAVVVFLIPTFVSIIFNLVGGNSEYKQCFNLATTSNINASYEIRMSKLMDEVRKDLNRNNYSVAFSYLSNIQDDDLRNSYKEELTKFKKELDEKSKSKEGSSSKANSSFIGAAKRVWDKIVNGATSFIYGPSAIPASSQVDCSGYVSWVLYEYGYKDFEGGQKSTSFFKNTNLKEKYGWEEVPFAGGTNILEMLKPGDIVVRDDGNNHGHTNIVGDIKDGNITVYDGGNNDYVTHGKYPQGITFPKDYFYFYKTDPRPGKIIRVRPA